VATTPPVPVDPRVDSGVTGGAIAPDEPAPPATTDSGSAPSGTDASQSQPDTPLSAVQPPPGGPSSGTGTTQGSQPPSSSSSSSSGDSSSSPKGPDH